MLKNWVEYLKLLAGCLLGVSFVLFVGAVYATAICAPVWLAVWLIQSIPITGSTGIAIANIADGVIAFTIALPAAHVFIIRKFGEYLADALEL